MTDQPSEYDTLLEALEDDQVPAKTGKARPSATARKRSSTRSGPRERATTAAAKTDPRPKRESGASDQRGDRAKPDYVQVNANIPRSLKASVYFYLKSEPPENPTTFSALVDKLLRDWVDERGGVFKPPSRKTRK